MDEQLVTKVSDIIHPVFLTGGSVRDLLLNKQPIDYDFSTPLLPQEIEDRVRQSGRKAFTIGKKFGTIGFKLDGRSIQVTTFRSESYSDGIRKPAVEFLTDLQNDLSRRDFTINAMAVADGKITDPFGGQLDLKSKLVKAVGDPNARFNEDPLRILRALRFASELGFTIEDTTKSAMAINAYRITSVSSERLMLELNKLLLGAYASDALQLMDDTRVLTFMIPEIDIRPELTYFPETNEQLALDLPARWAQLISAGHSEIQGREKVAFDRLIIGHASLYMKWSKNFTETVFEAYSNSSHSQNGEIR